VVVEVADAMGVGLHIEVAVGVGDLVGVIVAVGCGVTVGRAQPVAARATRAIARAREGGRPIITMWYGSQWHLEAEISRRSGSPPTADRPIISERRHPMTRSATQEHKPP
jgi:hypothetical protein